MGFRFAKAIEDAYFATAKFQEENEGGRVLRMQYPMLRTASGLPNFKYFIVFVTMASSLVVMKALEKIGYYDRLPRPSYLADEVARRNERFSEYDVSVEGSQTQTRSRM